MIDTHAHLTDERLMNQMEAVLARAEEAGVDKILVPSTGILDGRKAIRLAERYQNVWALVGIHPEVLAGGTKPEYRDEWPAGGGDWINRLEKLLISSKRVVGVGEIGLDFYYDQTKKSREIQMGTFQKQLEMAVKLDLPVVIHMRKAEGEMREVLTQMGRLPKGQFHCFAGSDEFLRFILEQNFHVSYCGNITYKSAERLREQVKMVPLGRLLLETDSPYLTPEDRRGSLNEPENVRILANYIADLRGIAAETLINQTTTNAQCLFFGG